MSWRGVCASLSLLLLLTALSAQEQLPLPEWAPWSWQDEHGVAQGLLPEASARIWTQPEQKPQQIAQSVPRILDGIKNGSWDYLYFYCGQDVRPYVAVDTPIYQVHSVLYAANNASRRSVQDFYGARIAMPGLIQFALPPAPAERPYIVHPVSSLEQGFALLRNGRVEAVLGSFEVIAWLQRQQRVSLDGLQAVDAKTPVSLCLHLHPRLAYDKAQWLAQRIKTLSEEGTFKAIAERYWAP